MECESLATDSYKINLANQKFTDLKPEDSGAIIEESAEKSIAKSKNFDLLHVENFEGSVPFESFSKPKTKEIVYLVKLS